MRDGVWPAAAITDPAQLGPLLRRRRTELGLRLEDAGAGAGLQDTHLGRIERGAASPRIPTLIPILDRLGLQLLIVDAGPADGVAVRLAELAEQVAELRTVMTWQGLRDLRQQVDAAVEGRADAEARVVELEARNAALAEEVAGLRRREAPAMRVELRELRARIRRFEEAFDALARQDVLTPELIEQARDAVDGTPAGREAA
ncbi:helix-turn-helix domain-containing protein [Phytohabitans houttuyneae]|uniref:helix-turn-helix domain-containing protein n=1 Tax=Phytohabitans houttuyneae TaxID=1076126 RepID=UPI001565F3DF|nr:helix-turn-helix transcriptional regulator [Phytohabitans houttuyneae]